MRQRADDYDREWMEYTSGTLTPPRQEQYLNLTRYDRNEVKEEKENKTPEMIGMYAIEANINEKVEAISWDKKAPPSLIFENRINDAPNGSLKGDGNGAVLFDQDEYWNGLFVQYKDGINITFVPLTTRCFGYLSSKQRIDRYILDVTDSSKLFIAKPKHHIIGLTYDVEENVINGIIETKIPRNRLNNAENKRIHRMNELLNRNEFGYFRYINNGVKNDGNIWWVQWREFITSYGQFVYCNNSNKWTARELDYK